MDLEKDSHEHLGSSLADELRRERLLDIEKRIAPYRHAGFVILAVTLLASAPWLGLWWLLPLAAAGVAFLFVDRMIPASRYPERWAAAGWAVSPLMIALSAALTGAAHSPAIYWFALPAVTLMARFERRGTVVGGAYIAALLLASTLLLEPSVVIDDPTPLLFAFALLLGTMLFGAALVDSEHEHRVNSVVDPLTGLLNRTALAQRLEDSNEGIGPPEPSYSLLMLDLDHFKRINDAHGHATGDAVLRDVAYAVRSELRGLDVAYRVGGEEFLVVLPGADRAGLELVGERLRKAVADCTRPGAEVRASVGGAYAGKGADDFEALSRAADAALYQAKREGRNCVRIAEVGPDQGPSPDRDAPERPGAGEPNPAGATG